MQFYIIHEDPIINAYTLPEYALQKVNIREGWQIMSDIGHRFGVTWEGQNKPYSPTHAFTRSLSHASAFLRFFKHYEACCNAYRNRYGKSRAEIDSFVAARNDIKRIVSRLPDTPTAETADYLLTAKQKHLTNRDVANLGKLV